MEKNKSLISHDESYSFTLINIEGDALKKVNNDKINAYYSLYNKKKSINGNENIIILLSETDEIEKNYIRYVDEYHAAGYDLFIVDVSKNKNAGFDLLEHLWLQHRGQLPQNIFIHGNNDQRENALLLSKNNIAKNNEIKGVILSSYLPKNEFIFPSDLEINTTIYFSYENPNEDYNNNIIYKELLNKNKKVKKFSFTNREEYNSFSELNKIEQQKTLKSLGYNNKKNEINKIKIGMPIKDQKIFSQIAEEKGIIIGVRPIDVNSTSLISSGEYSSKNLAIKAKSSDWGPMAGFIPVDQSLAKASAQKNLLKYNKAVEEAINSGAASVSKLYISAERVNELVENKVIDYLYDKNSPIKFEVIHNNKTHEFFLEPKIIENKQYYLVQYYNHSGTEPVLVMSDPISNKPMIADYDLFTVIYPYSHLGTNTRVNKPVSWEEWKQSVNYAELTDKQKILYNDKLLYEKNEGHQLGFISQQIKELKKELNTALGRSTGMEIVHHGADDANPFAVIHDNFPATFFVPKSLLDKPLNSKNQTLDDLFYINNNGTVVLKSPDEFSKFQQFMIDLGYIAPLNEKWNDGSNNNYFTKKQKISSKFVDTKKEIGRKFSIDKKDKYTLEYESSLNKFNEGSYVENNSLLPEIEFDNNEINLLSSEYNRKNDLSNKMNNVNHLLPRKVQREFYSKKRDIQWFKRTGYKLLKSLINKDGIFLNKTNEKKLISFFSLLSKYPNINTPIYKSFSVENSNVLKNNYKKGKLLAFDGVFYGFSNIEKVKKISSDNVYISIIGKHNAKPLTSLNSGSSERAIIVPGTHFRVIKNKIINNKNYVVLEIANEIHYQEPVFDLYDGELKGIGIDKHRTTFSEKIERNLNVSKLNNIFESCRGESLKSVTIKNIIDKIIEGKISVEYATHKYFKEISKVFSSENSTLLSNKLYIAINDPLISKSFNQYVNKKITLDEWINNYNVNYLNDTVTNNIDRVKTLINCIHDVPESVRHLNDASTNLLSHYFNEFDKNKLTIDLLKIALNKNEYNVAINDIDYLITLNNDKKISSSVEIKELRELIKKVSHEKKLNDNLFELSLGLNNNKIIVNKIKIYGIEVEKRLLISLGVRINNKKIEDIDVFEKKHDYSNLTFDADKINDYFFSASGTDDDKKAILIIKKLLKNKEKNIKKLISMNAERIDYLASYERLVKILELKKTPFNKYYWDSVRKPSLKIPRHMKILSKVGYTHIGYSIWQSVNNTFSLAEQLNNPNISLQQRKEIITNLSLMWSEMAFNGASEIIEIVIAKGLLRYRNNPLEYISKISTRVGIALNILSVGFDIYNAYDNFSRISGETDEKKKIDYIVNGSLAVVSGLVTVGISIAMLAGSTIAGPIGIVAGTLIALATSIYNAVRLIEEAKKQVSFTPMEELDNGFYAFLMGDIKPDKKNKIIYLDTENQLEEMIDKKALTYFEEINKQNLNSFYFYTNEKQIYQECYYYRVIPILIGETVDSMLMPSSDFIIQHMAKNMSQQEAEEIAALNSHLYAKKTEYKYYLPKEAIATDEKLIFDVDFYANELNRYTIKVASEDENVIFGEMVDEDFFKNSRTTKNYVIDKLGESKLENGLIKVNDIEKYYTSGWHENSVLYFNTHNGNDIISAPSITQNTFDIYNGTKRLSGGSKDDVFNVFTSESPHYASRFYGREGNDTLCLIKSTGKYTGYKVNLQHNYVKFKDSEDKTNSQNFHSKLYLYQNKGNLYSKKLVDTMPNIELQDQKVIAYLDSIENVIGSEIGDDYILGNEEANYLNGAGGVDHLYGKGGNDTLVLNEGYAEGGEGNDSYIILRSYLEQNYNKLFETIINENNKFESSVVRFNYYFDEIISIKRNKKDIIFDFKIDNENQEGKHIYHSVTLKNVYNDSVNNTPLHHYTLITQDGFALTLDENTKDKVLYKFSYLEKYNESNLAIKDFYINEDSNLFITVFKDQSRSIKLLPELKYSGLSSGTNLRFGIQGNNQNNSYFGIEANSCIKLSQGNDSYQIKTFLIKNKNERVNISLSDYIDKLTNDDVNYFFLTDISGFDLTFKDGLLSHRYLPNDYLTLSFDPELLNKIVDINVTIRLIDKDNVVFTLPTQDSHSNLLMPMVNLNLNISQGDDLLVIPESLILNKEALSTYVVNSSYSTLLSEALADKPKELIDLLPIIELNDGDDIIANNNNVSSVIDGGKGDDNILVNTGHHILIAGEGNDRLIGGEGNDLLISQFGHDYLSGGEGNNVYVVQKRQSCVTIYDGGKNSHILVTGLAENETLISSQVGNNTQYQTQDKQFTLIVEMAENEVNEQEQKSVISITKTSSELSLQGVANIIQEMAIFNQQQLTTVNNHEAISLSTWSPLAVVKKQL
ncbi:anthrax toxin-like adenylyl cyclase domain-containing protein [Proteus penneri]|uniref:anthrax toxin-like adenylyl cyclase domain-containing protein n=1 Tax=Proteus penneri TaxID=102862 RepID=UPI00288B2403|nr:anthrax toxin-like adenylyl cyclase domain-containing protein [Proteus penneri]